MAENSRVGSFGPSVLPFVATVVAVTELTPE
jgi:hypothetical protein